MRLFFALWPPIEAAQALAAWAAEVQRSAGGRVVPAANVHLTLAFLGETDAERAAVGAARRVEGERFFMHLNSARYWKHNSIVWAGPHEAPVALASLVEKLQLELFRAAFMLDRRPFAAHITLLRKASAPGPLPVLPPVAWPVDEFLLVRSDRDGSGSAYVPVERFSLTG